jgi:hypothetical protein
MPWLKRVACELLAYSQRRAACTQWHLDERQKARVILAHAGGFLPAPAAAPSPSSTGPRRSIAMCISGSLLWREHFWAVQHLAHACSRTPVSGLSGWAFIVPLHPSVCLNLMSLSDHCVRRISHSEMTERSDAMRTIYDCRAGRNPGPLRRWRIELPRESNYFEFASM